MTTNRQAVRAARELAEGEAFDRGYQAALDDAFNGLLGWCRASPNVTVEALQRLLEEYELPKEG